MKLLSCQIENFGKLSHFSYDFDERISSLNEENGFGKSTFCAFLLAMFYGFEGDRKKNAERTFYTPWQGGVFGGRVAFEAGGKRYLLVRTFGKKESEDTFELYDLSTNLPSRDYSSSIGEELFRIDRNSFLKTAFIGQDALLTEATDHVNALIGNLSDDDADMTAYERTDLRLKEYLDKNSWRRMTGALHKQNEEIAGLKVREAAGPALEDTMQRVTEGLERTEEKIKALKTARAEAQSAFEQASEAAVKRQLILRHEELKDNVRQKARKTQELKSVFPGTVPEQFEFLSAIRAGTASREAASEAEENRLSAEEEARLQAGGALFMNGVPTEEEIEKALSSAYRVEDIEKDLREHALTPAEKLRYEALSPAFEGKKSDPSQSARKRLLFGILCTALSLMAAGLSYFLIPEGTFRTGGFIASGILLAAGLVLIFSARVKKHDAEKEEWKTLRHKKNALDEEELIRQKTALTSSLDAFLLRFGVHNGDTRYTDDLFRLSNQAAAFEKLLDKKSAFENAKKEEAAQKTALNAFFEKLKIEAQPDVTAQLNSLMTARSAYMNAERNEEEAETALKTFETEHDIEAIRAALSETSVPDIQEAKTALSSASDALDEAVRERNAASRRLEDLRNEYDAWAEGHERLIALEESYAEGIRKHRLIAGTKELLSKAKDTLTNRYSAPLLNAFSHYYEEMTGVSDSRYSMDAKSRLSYEKEGRQRDIGTFSKGYQDLLSLCLRFSFIDAMYPDEKPFVILDDPFTNLDTQKTAHAMAFLEHAAERYQLVYLTCHDSRAFVKGETV